METEHYWSIKDLADYCDITKYKARTLLGQYEVRAAVIVGRRGSATMAGYPEEVADWLRSALIILERIPTRQYDNGGALPPILTAKTFRNKLFAKQLEIAFEDLG